MSGTHNEDVSAFANTLQSSQTSLTTYEQNMHNGMAAMEQYLQSLVAEDANTAPRSDPDCPEKNPSDCLACVHYVATDAAFVGGRRTLNRIIALGQQIDETYASIRQQSTVKEFTRKWEWLCAELGYSVNSRIQRHAWFYRLKPHVQGYLDHQGLGSLNYSYEKLKQPALETDDFKEAQPDLETETKRKARPLLQALQRPTRPLLKTKPLSLRIRARGLGFRRCTLPRARDRRLRHLPPGGLDRSHIEPTVQAARSDRHR